MKILTKILAAIALSLSLNVNAGIISGPIDYTTSGLVGTADAGTGAVNPNEEAVWAQYLLDMTFNTSSTSSGVDYVTSITTEYSGTIDALDYTKDESQSGWIESGWEWVMAKYDGQNAGYVMYYLGGEAMTIPEYSDSIWMNNQDNGYQLSHWTTFNSTSVPEPTIIALFAVGLFSIGFARRRKA